MKSLPIFTLALASAHGAAAFASPDIPDKVDVHGPIAVAPPDAIPEGSWQTSAEVGAITTSGNTTGTSVTGKIEARLETPKWSHELAVSGFFKEDEFVDDDGRKQSARSAERYAMSAKAAFKLLGVGKRAFVLATHVNDKFGAYTHYSSLGIGHGLRWHESDGKTFDVEIGPGYFSGERATGEQEQGFTVRGATQFKWRVSPSALFVQTVSVERGTSNTHSVAETSLRTKINGTMQMKAGFSARNDSNVPIGKTNTDTQTSLTMVYSF